MRLGATSSDNKVAVGYGANEYTAGTEISIGFMKINSSSGTFSAPTYSLTRDGTYTSTVLNFYYSVSGADELETYSSTATFGTISAVLA